ncbi:MAG: nuclear transport factor 2 family protein [Elusimicrobia bacterium]|nr:nuclear transport factor 2 family protein [Elusimicrobiota bacterium]MDE2238231.1 nuclear transport factor 2 family protein [Elusimicrobiota bacterium]MDE2425420.1 nuclear transport factor 2 family protein [Elusimicrobiota bacterium]
MRSLLAASLLLLAGCGGVGFERPISDREFALEAEIRDFYSELGRAYSAGDAQALALLYDPGIATPMTHDQIQAWVDQFFAERGPAAFNILALSFEQLGADRAVVRIKYDVAPFGKKPGFQGFELDTLVRRFGRWYIASWERLY